MGDGNSSERNAAEEVSRILEQSKELQESAAALISRNSQEEASLRQRALALDSNIKRVQSFIASSFKKGDLDPKDSEKLVDELSRARYTLSEGDAAAFLPSKSYGRFMRAFLGPINVHATRKDVQLKVKEEYNNFRVMGLEWMFSCIACTALPGVVTLSLHWVGSKREYFES